jgi:hypothetical protein
MKTKWLIVVCAWCSFFFCSNPAKENNVPGIDLSALDRADITLLASHFSQRNIDTISAGPTVYYGWMAPVNRENDYTGHVTFDSVYTDTDKISYQSLIFYNRYWYAYSAYGLPDSGLVSVKHWYSSLDYLYTTEKTVFKIDTLTIIAAVNGELKKTAIVDYLNKLYAIEADSADTNHIKIPADFSMARVTDIRSSVYQDTTAMNLQCGSIFTTYQFRFLSGNFMDASVMQIFF